MTPLMKLLIAIVSVLADNVAPQTRPPMPTRRAPVSPSPTLPPGSTRPPMPTRRAPKVGTREPSTRPTMTPTNTAEPTTHPSNLPTVSIEPTNTPSSRPSVSTKPTRIPSIRPSISIVPTRIPSIRPSISITPTSTPTNLPSISIAPTSIPSNRPSISIVPTSTPSIRPSISITPTRIPSNHPSESVIPSNLPSTTPTHSVNPSHHPSSSPSVSTNPTLVPSAMPSDSIKPSLTNKPSVEPSSPPSSSTYPTSNPSIQPSLTTKPTSIPSSNPTITTKPTHIPSNMPSLSTKPSETTNPSTVPTTSPSISANPSLSFKPSMTANPSTKPSSPPSLSIKPSRTPSKLPSLSPLPTQLPSASPSLTARPSIIPTTSPSTSTKPSSSTNPSDVPTTSPSSSTQPTVVPSSTPSLSTKPSLSTTPSIVPSSPPSLSSNPTTPPTATVTLSTEPTIGPTTSPRNYALIGTLEGGIGTPTGPYDEFGTTVSLNDSGDTLAVGAPRHYVGVVENAGRAQTFQYGGGTTWNNVEDFPGTEEDEYVGTDVALSGDNGWIAYAATPFNSAESGYVKIINRGTAGSEQTFSGNDFYGSTISLSRNGNRFSTSSSKITELYEYQSGTNVWSSIGTFSCTRAKLSSDGQVIAFQCSGGVEIRQRNNGNWQQLGNTITSGGASNFGVELGLSQTGKTVIIGTNSNYAEVYQFDESENDWNRVGNRLEGDNPDDCLGSSCLFGQVVSISDDGTVICLGSKANSSGGKTRRGRARVLELVNNSIWRQIGSDIVGDDSFFHVGWSVSVSSNGNRFAIGAKGEPCCRSGKVYIYEIV